MSTLLDSALIKARQIMTLQAVNTNNLANASTSGFRAELAYVTNSEVGTEEVSGMPNFSVGTVQNTGRSLDVAINGDGWIAIAAADGSEAYSRRGDLHVDAFGQLKDGVGHPIIGNSGPIALPPFSSVEIGADGTISVLPLGQSPNTLAVVDRIKLVTVPDGQLFRSEDGLMRVAQGEEAAADSSVRLLSGSLEGSNVNVVSEMVNMIELSRRFEAQIQLMQSAKEDSASLSKILSMN